MLKRKTYRSVKFPPEVFKEALDVFRARITYGRGVHERTDWSVDYGREAWDFDGPEEFYAEYRKDIDSGSFRLAVFEGVTANLLGRIHMEYERHETDVWVTLASREAIESVFGVLDANEERSRLPEDSARKTIQESVKIFIGHGRSDQWRELKDHLHDKHHFQVLAYETGARAGYTITEALEGMAEEASFALLVHTGEDMGKDDVLRARENVIHETGLFQGKLGFRRAIVLLEEGCNELTNISGLQQLRFPKGKIREVFGDVLAIIYREFGVEESEDSNLDC